MNQNRRDDEKMEPLDPEPPFVTDTRFLLARFSYIFIEIHIDMSVCSYISAQVVFILISPCNQYHLQEKPDSRILCACPMRPLNEVLMEMAKRFIVFCFCYFRGSPAGQICCCKRLNPMIFQYLWCRNHVSFQSVVSQKNSHPFTTGWLQSLFFPSM